MHAWLYVRYVTYWFIQEDLNLKEFFHGSLLISCMNTLEGNTYVISSSKVKFQDDKKILLVYVRSS